MFHSMNFNDNTIHSQERALHPSTFISFWNFRTATNLLLRCISYSSLNLQKEVEVEEKGYNLRRQQYLIQVAVKERLLANRTCHRNRNLVIKPFSPRGCSALGEYKYQTKNSFPIFHLWYKP